MDEDAATKAKPAQVEALCLFLNLSKRKFNPRILRSIHYLTPIVFLPLQSHHFLPIISIIFYNMNNNKKYKDYMKLLNLYRAIHDSKDYNTCEGEVVRIWSRIKSDQDKINKEIKKWEDVRQKQGDRLKGFFVSTNSFF